MFCAHGALINPRQPRRGTRPSVNTAEKCTQIESSTLGGRYHTLIQRLRAAEARFGRPENGTCLVAISKTYPAQAIREVAALGQMNFGENQLQDALSKMEHLGDLKLTWHFVGPIQSNKCRDIAIHFNWAHSVDRLKIASRLSNLRPSNALPLNVFLQVNLQNEPTKTGVTLDALEVLADAVCKLPRLTLRGLMAIPAPELDLERQRAVFARLRKLQVKLNRNLGLDLDCLSMGMTDDLEAAVAEGATHVRVGTAIFGPRKKPGT
mgnify:FL=1|jgi:pyridoxal phosphate enzyme (YggS family)|tara:strand:- start:1224 stop:2018 length:795 start_codon:yes stop_codon:yes gene_type:complete